jgi:hypothetical protein
MIARPMGDGGACSISKTAGKNSTARPAMRIGARLECTASFGAVTSVRQAARQTPICRDTVFHNIKLL